MNVLKGGEKYELSYIHATEKPFKYLLQEQRWQKDQSALYGAMRSC